MDARVGIWSGHEPVSGGAGQVAIATVHYNAAGDDNENLNDEYITIRNSGTTTADLTSWQIRDSDGFVYTLPSVSLSSKESMKIHTGNGTPSAGEIFMGSPDPVLDNDGDTITSYRPGRNGRLFILVGLIPGCRYSGCRSTPSRGYARAVFHLPSSRDRFRGYPDSSGSPVHFRACAKANAISSQAFPSSFL